MANADPRTPRHWTGELVTAAFFSFTLAFFSPVFIYLTNVFEFPFNLAAVLPVLLGLASALFVLVFLLLRLWARSRERLLALFFSLGFLLWLQGNILLWDYGVLDGRCIDWAQHAGRCWLDASVWLLFLLPALLWPRRISQLARVGSLFLLCIQLLYLVLLGLRAPQVEGKNKMVFSMSDRHVYSRSQNVIILVVDTFQSDTFQEIIDQDAELGEIFRDFTYFRNCLGGFNGTFFSVPLILSGRSWNPACSVEEFIKETFLSGSLPFVLKNRGFQVELYPLAFPGIYYSPRIASNLVARKELPPGAAAFLLDLALFRQLPSFLKKKVYNDRAWLLRRLVTDTPRSLKKRKRRQRRLEKTIMSLNKDRENIGALEARLTLIDRPVFKYDHWRGLHPPLAFNEDCNYQEMAYDRAHYLRQVRCVLRLLARFLDALRQAGIYDNSLIVIAGDHGVLQDRIGVRFETAPGVWALDHGGGLAINIRQSALPLLLVKRIASTQPEMRRSDAPVTLGDIARTVFDEIGVRSNVPGTSLFSLAEGQERSRSFHLVKRGIQGAKGLQRIRVDGFAWRPESWPQKLPAAGHPDAGD